MTHYSGNRYTTYFSNGTNLNTTLSSDGNTISFANGTSWSRSSSSSTNSAIVTGTWSYTETNKKPLTVAIKKTGSKSYKVIAVGNDAADAWWNSAIINHVSGSKYQISYSTGVSTEAESGPIDITVSNNGKNMTSNIASWTYTSSRTF